MFSVVRGGRTGNGGVAKIRNDPSHDSFNSLHAAAAADTSCQAFSTEFSKLALHMETNSWPDGCDPESFLNDAGQSTQTVFQRFCSVDGQTTANSCGGDGFAGIISRIIAADVDCR